MEPTEIDLPTLTSLAGPGVTTHLLRRTAAAGFPGVRPSHGYVIQQLVDAEPTIKAIARALGMTQQGASKQVTDLERLGLAERFSVDGDQRVRRVRLTEKGEQLLAVGRQQRAELEAALVERVGEECVRQARRAVAQLLDLVGMSDRVSTRTVPLPHP